MASDYSTSPADLKHLIERFDDNIDAYRTGQYNETQIGANSSISFFTLLDWDVDNSRIIPSNTRT